MKKLVLIFLMIFFCLETYSQKEISTRDIDIFFSLDYSSKIDEYLFKKNIEFVNSINDNLKFKETYKIYDTVLVNSNVNYKYLFKGENPKTLQTTLLNNYLGINKSSKDPGTIFKELFLIHYKREIPMEFQRSVEKLNNRPHDIRHVIYSYLPKSGLMLYQIKQLKVNDYQNKNEYKYEFYIFHPIYGPLKISLNKGSLILDKFIGFQIDVSKFENSNDYFNTKERYPFSYGTSIHFDWKTNIDGTNFRNDGEGCWGEWEKRENYENSIKLFDNTETFDKYSDIRVGKKTIFLKSDTEYKYYPTWDEKFYLSKCCGLPKIDLLNPNFYIFKQVPAKGVTKYSLINKNYTLLTEYNWFDELSPIELNNIYITKLNGRFGLVYMSQENIQNNSYIILDTKFDKVLYKGDGIFEITNDGKKDYINLMGKELLIK